MKHLFATVIYFFLLLTSIRAQQNPGVRAHHELVYDEKNKVVVLTAGSSPLNGGSSYEMYDDVWKFDGKEWKKVGNTGDRRSGIKMVYDSKRKQLYSFGGWLDGNSLSDLRLLENARWKTISDLPNMKASEPGFVYDAARDKLVVFGGSSAPGLVNNETWEWNGSIWKKFEGPGPQGRQAFVMAYDSKRKKTILFGGMDGTGKQFNDLWEFDGAKWDSIPVSGVNPGSRISPGYAFDNKRGLLVIFGGISGQDRKNDTWSWNGKEWKQSSNSGPSARAMGYMAYDKKRDRIVLFGGRLSWPTDANDTWEWDGMEWKEIK